MRRPEVALLVLVVVLVGMRRRELVIALVAFAAAQALGQWLAGQRLMVMSVFLPQVAPEQKWDSQRFAEQLALKAGLARDGWRDATLATFRAEVFGENA